jgi:hypothetical protein
VRTKLRIETAFLALICLSCALPQRSASAITAELAKKCGALSEKAYPPRVIGNPAAGRQNGTTDDFRNYFSKCIANGGNPPQQNQNKVQSPDAGGDKNGQTQKTK